MRTVEPRIGQVFVDAMLAANEVENVAHRANRPEGMPTFSYSAVMGCARQAGYKAAHLPETDPMDGASLAITNMGKVLHSDMQGAASERWPQATFEGTSVVDDLIWGYYDLDDPDADEVVEMKTVGAYKFDLAIGLFRSPGRGKPAFMKPAGGQGPSISHICQGGFNALGQGRSNVRIVYLSREAVSVKKAEEAGLDSIGRFWAEWVFGPEIWKPLVDAEIERLAKVRAIVEAGELPDRVDCDDDGKPVKVNRDTHWRCSYCNQATRCQADGPGRIPVVISAARSF